MEYKLKQYIRDNDRNLIGLMVAIVDSDNNNYVHIGVSLCHKEDKFDKDKAHELAILRATNPNKWYKIKGFYSCVDEGWRCHVDIEEQINKFMTRAMTYFQDKMVVIPKIKTI